MSKFDITPDSEEFKEESGKFDHRSNSPSSGISPEKDNTKTEAGNTLEKSENCNLDPEIPDQKEKDEEIRKTDQGSYLSSSDSQDEEENLKADESINWLEDSNVVQPVLEESNSEDSEDYEDLNDSLRKTPYIPESVYQSLPELLKDCCNQFQDPREKDSFLTAAITVLSGCVKSINGTYDRRTVNPNLYCFIVASSANGKGCLIFAKSLGAKIHNRLLAQSETKKENYKAELKRYREIIRQNLESNETAPSKPEFKALFFPANTSSAALIDLLNKADGSGIIFETEADTMSNSLKQDWGGYSDFLRKAFHNESISYSRKTNAEYVEITNPQISVVLSGTRTQVRGLFPSAEDGLFSRFTIYTFKANSNWRNVFPEGEVNLSDFFDEKGVIVEKMADFLEKSPTKFFVTSDQKDTLNSQFSILLKKTTIFVSEETASIVKRLGLITFRIAMILTAVRKFEAGSEEAEVTCTDVDFYTALSLTGVYLEHALQLFKELPKAQENALRKNVQRFFDSLPADRKFTRLEAVHVGSTLAIKPRTVDKYLSEMNGIFLEQEFDNGPYEKIVKE